MTTTEAAATADLGGRLADRLGATPGLELLPGEPLARHTTFRIGGPAEVYAVVESEAALRALLVACAGLEAPFVVLGLGSNVLVPDEGLPGVVARLAGSFLDLTFDGGRVVAGAALPLGQVAKKTASAGLAGLEALSGFPSTVGGAVYMNAGCYGVEIRDVLAEATLVDRRGEWRRVAADDLEPEYRRTNLEGTGTIVTRAVFRLAPGDPAALLARIDELNRKRRDSLPSDRPNAGSIFKNPPGDYAGRLIDECGLKGTRSGGAQISPKHGNVIVNLKQAAARDVLALMLCARHAVEARFGVALEPEVVLTGGLAALWRRGIGASR